MKTQLLLCPALCSIMMIAMMAICFTACNDEDETKTVPEVTTTVVTGITSSTAMGGGEITSDGNAAISVSGLCWSATNTTPTTADSKTELATTNGTFTSLMEGLTSGTTYHVRAYATNSMGISYGAVVSFTTDNAAPVATNVTVSGTAQVLEQLTATYIYSDTDNDTQSGTTFQWYRANDGAGSAEAAISGATELTYSLQADDEFKFVRIGVTPKAATGINVGTEVKSAFVGPVAEEPSTVTFMYNGQSVTYGIIVSSTGRRWLDRNLGAPNMPTAYDDFENYGDLFQWGRGADGHQLVSRTSTPASTTGINGTTTTLSTSDSPGHSQFILISELPADWRSPSNDNLWQGVNGINNPCPSGWRIPSQTEWEAENLTDVDVAYTKIKITNGGYRSMLSGAFTGGTYGVYWSATIAPNGGPVYFFSDTQNFVPAKRAIGSLCRCIKD